MKGFLMMGYGTRNIVIFIGVLLILIGLLGNGKLLIFFKFVFPIPKIPVFSDYLRMSLFSLGASSFQLADLIGLFGWLIFLYGIKMY